jgi:porin
MSRHDILPVVALLFVAWSSDVPAQETGAEESLYGGSLLSRSKLTGDWGGLRTKLAKRGITVDVDVLQTYQDVVEGGRNDNDAYGGSADFVANADFGKLGLWPGGFLKLFGEVQFGNNVNSDTGAVTAASTDALFPLPSGDDATLTSVVFTQFLTERKERYEP